MKKFIFRTHQRGCGDIMVWMCIYACGKPYLVFVSGGIDSPKHASILANTLIPFTDAAYMGMSRFQLDNA